MRLAPLATLPLFALALAACESEAERQADRTEDLIERQADASAAAAGDTIVALGLTERQLLDADLVAADGTDLGDVAQVHRVRFQVHPEQPPGVHPVGRHPPIGVRAQVRGRVPEVPAAVVAVDDDPAHPVRPPQDLRSVLDVADGPDLGDVEQVRRGLDGKIEGLVVEIDDSDPDRFVIVPLDGLTTRPDGDETDVQTTLTREQLAALPDAAVDPVAPSPTS